MRRLKITAMGQLQSADVQLGDLTVLVGRQASGKTIFLETLKLVVDVGYVHSQLSKHGLEWNKDPEQFFDIFLGEGMHHVLSEDTAITVDGKNYPVLISDPIRRTALTAVPPFEKLHVIL